MIAKHSPSSKSRSFCAHRWRTPAGADLSFVRSYLDIFSVWYSAHHRTGCRRAQELRPATKRVMLRQARDGVCGSGHEPGGYTVSWRVAASSGVSGTPYRNRHLRAARKYRVTRGPQRPCRGVWIVSRAPLSPGASVPTLVSFRNPPAHRHGEIPTRRAVTYALCKITGGASACGRVGARSDSSISERGRRTDLGLCLRWTMMYVLQGPVRDSCPGLSRMLSTSAAGVSDGILNTYSISLTVHRSCGAQKSARNIRAA
jgi:hypothetical protein